MHSNQDSGVRIEKGIKDFLIVYYSLVLCKEFLGLESGFCWAWNLNFASPGVGILQVPESEFLLVPESEFC